LEGRSRCNKIVVIDAKDRTAGELVHVKVERATAFTLYAARSTATLS
jgi:hypothetical protein